MSSYIHFFARKGDVFVPLGVYGRSTRVYNAFESLVSYGHIRALSADELMIAHSYLLSEADFEAKIASIRKRIELITKFNNSIGDKINVIHDLEEEIEESRELQRDERDARAFIGILHGIIDVAAFGNVNSFNPDECVYAGIECSNEVSVQDIGN